MRKKVTAMALSGSISLLPVLASPDLVCPSQLLISAGVICDPQCPRECGSG